MNLKHLDSVDARYLAIVAAVLMVCIGLGSVYAYSQNALLDTALTPLQISSNPSQCSYIDPYCHGERYAINKDYWFVEPIITMVSGSTLCDLYAAPIDNLNYSVEWKHGKCSLNAEKTRCRIDDNKKEAIQSCMNSDNMSKEDCNWSWNYSMRSCQAQKDAIRKHYSGFS